MSHKVGVLGSGSVGQALANGLKDLGYEVTIGNRSGHAVDSWNGAVAKFMDAAEQAELIVLCVKGTVAEELVAGLTAQLSGKTVIDTTNPISSEPAIDGVLNYFTSYKESLMERLQRVAPEAHFVKAFNSVGYNEMVNPSYASGKPSMFICGNDDKAKKEVSKILDGLGWETEDMGSARAASAIEPLCILWCIPAFRHGQRTHAFKLLKK